MAEEKKNRLEILDALRGLACVWVALYHFTANFQATAGFPTGQWINFLGADGYLGVYPFFVISGLVLPYSLDRAKFHLSGYGRFVGKRFLRLHPLYLISLAFCILVMRLPGGWSDIWPHFFYLNAVLHRPWYMELYWTLGLEIQYSLVIALIFPLLSHPLRWVRWLTLAAFLLPAVELKDPVWVSHYTGFYSLGILIFWKLTGREGWVSTLLGMLVSAWVIRQGHGNPHLILAVLTAGLMLAFTGRNVGSFLGWLGRISYAMYLFHMFIGQPILELAIRLPRGVVTDSLAILIALAAAIVGAGLIYRYVELPIAAWTAKFWKRGGKAAR